MFYISSFQNVKLPSTNSSTYLLILVLTFVFQFDNVYELTVPKLLSTHSQSIIFFRIYNVDNMMFSSVVQNIF